MFGKLGDMMGKLQEAKKIAAEIKERLEATILHAEAADGDIKIEINGNKKIRSIYIAPALQHGDPQQLREQLTTGINRAIEKAEKVYEEEMKKAAGGLMPGLFQ